MGQTCRSASLPVICIPRLNAAASKVQRVVRNAAFCGKFSRRVRWRWCWGPQNPEQSAKPAVEEVPNLGAGPSGS